MKSRFKILTGLAMLGITALSALPAVAHEVSEKEIFLGYLKLDNPDDLSPFVDDYENLFVRFDERIPRDEFHADRGQQYEAMIKKAVANYDVTGDYVLNFNAQVGDYDVAAGTFDFKPISASTSFRVGYVTLVFENTVQFSGLKVAPDLAEKIATKDFREVEATAHIEPVSTAEDPRKMVFKITKIEVFRKGGHDDGPIAVLTPTKS